LKRSANFRPENRSAGNVRLLDIPIQLGFDEAILNESMLTYNVQWKTEAERHSGLNVIPRSRVRKAVKFLLRGPTSFFESGFKKVALVGHDQDGRDNRA
jgi:hypothetical protein